MEQQKPQKLQRNLHKEIAFYQVEYANLMADNIALKAQIDDLLEQLNKKDEAVSQ